MENENKNFIKKIKEKYSSLPVSLKSAVWFTIALLLQKGMNIILTPVFTRIMSKDDYGTFSLYNTWYNIFLIVCTFNLFGSIFNTILNKYQDRQDEVSTSVVGFNIVTTSVVFLIYLLYHSLFGDIQGLNFNLGVLIFVQIVSITPMSIWLAKGKYQNKYFVPSIIIIAQSILSTIFTITSVLLMKDKVYARIISNIVIMALFSLIALIALLKKNKKIFNFKYWKYFFILGLPLVFHYLSQDIMSQSDQLIIDMYYTKDAVASYSLAHSLVWVCTIIITAINTAFTPWLYKKMNSKSYDKINDISNIINIIICFVVICISLLSKEIILIFGGSDYLDGAQIVPILAPSLLMISSYDLFSSVEFYYSKTIQTSIITFVCAAINLLLNFIMIPKFGIIGASLSTIFSYFLMALAHYFVMKYYMKKNSLPELFGSKKILFRSILVSLISICFIFLMPYIWIRIVLLLIIIAVFVGFFLFNKQKVKSLIYK